MEKDKHVLVGYNGEIEFQVMSKLMKDRTSVQSMCIELYRIFVMYKLYKYLHRIFVLYSNILF